MTHVLVARLDSDGDVLLMGPAIRAVAAHVKQVTLLCGPRGRQAAELLPGVDELVVYRAPWIDPDPGPVERDDVLGLVDRLAGLEVDEAIVFTSFHQSPLPLALLLRLAGTGSIAAISPDYPGSLLDIRHSVPDDLHEVERALSLVAALGYELRAADTGALEVVRRPEARPRELPEEPYVVVHPGASVPARAWAPERFAELVAALVDQGRTVVVTGGPAEAALTARVARPRPDDVIDLGGRTDLAGLAEVLAAAEVLIVGNTGPAHLAAAVKTPVVSLFAPTVPAARWHPWGTRHILLGRQDIGCAGCRAKVCPFEGHPCLDSVPVEQVLDAVETLAPSRVPELAA